MIAMLAGMSSFCSAVACDVANVFAAGRGVADDRLGDRYDPAAVGSVDAAAAFERPGTKCGALLPSGSPALINRVTARVKNCRQYPEEPDVEIARQSQRHGVLRAIHSDLQLFRQILADKEIAAR